MKTTTTLASALALPSILACAGYPAPNDRLANSYASIRSPEELGAAATPEAALHLKLAEEEQAKARAFMANNDNERADNMSLRANADAELAIALARNASAETKLTQEAAHAASVAKNGQTPAGPTSFSATTTTTSTVVPAVGGSR
jgi:hypothetical protein